jgi:hypothetical protein
MLSKPNFFLDTSVCIDVAREKTISANDRARTWGICKTKLRYCISPVTAYEPLAGLAESDEAHFIESRKAISVLCPADPKRFLCQLSVFVPNTIFGEVRKPVDSVDTNFDLWMKAIMRSPSKTVLQSGRLRIGLKARNGFGLDLESICKSIRDIQAGYARLFDSFRKSCVSDLTRDIWAEMVLNNLGKPGNSPNVIAVLERLTQRTSLTAICGSSSAILTTTFQSTGEKLLTLSNSTICVSAQYLFRDKRYTTQRRGFGQPARPKGNDVRRTHGMARPQASTTPAFDLSRTRQGT